MADETNKAGGKTRSAGGVTLKLNPPEPKKEGVNYAGSWVRAELDDEGKFTVRIFGQAQYGDRTLSDHVELTDPGLEPIKDMLAQVLDAYAETIKTAAMGGAFTARAFALGQGESLVAPAKTEGK